VEEQCFEQFITVPIAPVLVNVSVSSPLYHSACVETREPTVWKLRQLIIAAWCSPNYRTQPDLTHSDPVIQWPNPTRPDPWIGPTHDHLCAVPVGTCDGSCLCGADTSSRRRSCTWRWSRESAQIRDLPSSSEAICRATHSLTRVDSSWRNTTNAATDQDSVIIRSCHTRRLTFGTATRRRHCTKGAFLASLLKLVVFFLFSEQESC